MKLRIKIYLCTKVYCVKGNNEKTHNNFMSNLKSVTVILAQIGGLLSFCNTLRKVYCRSAIPRGRVV
jgi:hypothetical protein